MRDTRKFLLAASKGEHNQVDPDLVPGWDYAKLSRVAGYCHQRGFIESSEVTNLDSPHPEYLVLGLTVDGEDWLREHSLWSRTSRRTKALLVLLFTATGGTLVSLVVSQWQAIRDWFAHLLGHLSH